MKLLQIAALIIVIALYLSCTSVSPDDSLSWQVNYTLPLLNERLTVSMLGLKSLNIIDDSTRFGDTLFITRSDTLKREYTSTIFSPPVDYDTWYTGLPVLNRLKKIESTMIGSINDKLKIIDTIADGAVKQYQILWRDTVCLGPVKKIDFGETAEYVNTEIKNISESITARDVKYRLISMEDTIDFDRVESLIPGESVVIRAPVNGKTVGADMIIECQSKVDSEILNLESHLLSFFTDFNGLHFSSGLLKDSLISLNFSYKISQPFGQKGINAAYVDIASFELPFTIRNNMPAAFSVNATIENVWEKNYCIENSINSSADMSDFSPDSQFFKGNELIALTIPAYSDDENSGISEHNISFENARILPDWNESDTINALSILIRGRLEASGNWVSVDNMSETGIKFDAPWMDVSSIYAAYTVEKHIVSQPEKVSLLSQTPEIDMVTKLKNRLLPEMTNVNLQLQFQFPDNTSFEEVEISCAIFETDTGNIIDSLHFNMNDISAGKTFTYTNSFNQVLKKLPDSLGYLLTYIIKPGKNIFLDEEVLRFEDEFLMAKFDVDVTLDMTMNLVWSVVDTVNVSFNRKIESFPLSARSMELMNNKELELSVTLSNNSNIIGKLWAEAENVSTEQSGFDTVRTNMFGIDGLILPSRGSSKENRISYSQKEIKNLTSHDSIDVKWNLVLYPSDIDALKDTDYLEINAEMILKGEQSTESMFEY